MIEHAEPVHHPEVRTGSVVGILPPPQRLVELLGPSTSATGTTTTSSFISTTSAPVPLVSVACVNAPGIDLAPTLAPLIVEVQEHMADRPLEVRGRQ
jgi:hypothetical protein